MTITIQVWKEGLKGNRTWTWRNTSNDMGGYFHKTSGEACKDARSKYGEDLTFEILDEPPKPDVPEDGAEAFEAGFARTKNPFTGHASRKWFREFDAAAEDMKRAMASKFTRATFEFSREMEWAEVADELAEVAELIREGSTDGPLGEAGLGYWKVEQVHD